MKNSVTEERLKSIITNEQYWNNGKTTVCILTLKNGFEITGTSAVVDKNNFNEAIGKQIAYQKAFDQLWLVEGYYLQCKLFGENDTE